MSGDISREQEEILLIYKGLPPLRRKVLNRLLVGYSARQVAQELFLNKKDPLSSVAGHLKEIYKNFEFFLERADPESKRSHLIILFYSDAPALVADLKMTLGSPIPSRNPPQFEELIDAIERSRSEHKFELQRVSRADIPALQVLGRRYFNTQDHLPTELLRSWHRRDPNGFRKVVNKAGRTVGFFIVLFLKEVVLQQFANGSLVEREISASRIIAADETQRGKEKSCYVSVVAGETGNAIANVCILLALGRYLDELRRFRRIEKLYGMAATNSGKDLMRDHLGFKLCVSGERRRDGEEFFEAEIDEYPSLFSYLVSNFKAFKRYEDAVDFGNEQAWMPCYPSDSRAISDL